MDKINEILEKIRDHEKITKIVVTLLIIITAILFFVFSEKSEGDIIIPTENEDLISENENNVLEDTGVDCYIDIEGEVKNPGVYKVSQGTRVFQVIEKAGGLTGKADTNSINQAEVVEDGQKIIIESKNKNNLLSGNVESNNSGSNGLININNASSTELEEIPGVGPSKASKIIEYRESQGGFKNKEEIKKIDGIGDKTFEKMKDKINV